MPVILKVIDTVKAYFRGFKSDKTRQRVGILKDHVGIVPFHDAVVNQLVHIRAHTILHQDAVHAETVDQVRLYTEVLPVIEAENFLDFGVVKAFLRRHAGNVDTFFQKGCFDFTLGTAGGLTLCLRHFAAGRPRINNRREDTENKQYNHGEAGQIPVCGFARTPVRFWRQTI